MLLAVEAPNAYSSSPYMVWYYDNWISDEYTKAFEAGKVVKCVTSSSITIDNPVTIFRDE